MNQAKRHPINVVDRFQLPPQKSPARSKTKNITPKAQKTKPRNPITTTAKAAARQEKRREYDRQRSHTPERRENNRLIAQERRRKAKELNQSQGEMCRGMG